MLCVPPAAFFCPFAAAAGNLLHVQLNGKDFRNADYKDAERLALDEASRMAESQALDAIEENLPDDEDQSGQVTAPEISRFAFAMFDVLGFSHWVETESLGSIVGTYRQLIERAVLRPNEKGGLTAFHTAEGQLLAVARAPAYAYFSDTI